MSTVAAAVALAQRTLRLALARLFTWEVLKYALLTYAILRVGLALLLWLFLPSLSMGTIGISSVRNIKWQSPSKSGNTRSKSDRIRVEARHVGWTWRFGGWRKREDGCMGTSGWFVLRCQDVKITIPRSWIVTPAADSAFKSPTATPPSTSATTLAWLPHLLPLVSLFALEIHFEVVVEDAFFLTGVVGVGSKVSTFAKLEPSRLVNWITLDRLRIVELAPASTPAGVRQPEHTGPSPPKLGFLPAVAMSERVMLTASLPLSAMAHGLGRASVDVGILFGRGKEGVHVRIHELKRVLRSVESISRERRKLLGPSAVPASLEGHCDGNEPASTSSSTKQTPTPLSYLRFLELRLPLVIVSAHYSTPLHILASAASTRPLPQSVGFALTLKGLEAKLWLAGSSDEVYVSKGHRSWIGRHRELAFAAFMQWDAIAGRVKVDGSEEDILPDSNKAFSVARSSISASSTWLPSHLALALPLPLHATAPIRNFNDDTLVVEASLGAVRGHATFEIFDSALRIFNGRPRPTPLPKDSSRPPEHKALRGLPRLVGVITWEHAEARIQAPSSSEAERVSEDPPSGHFFREWQSPDVFCISLPNGAASFGSEYRDRSVRRTEAERSAVRRLQQRESVEKGSSGRRETDSPSPTPSLRTPDIDETAAPTANLVADLGIPPPPPVNRREHRHWPAQPRPSDPDLESHPISYSWRLNVHGGSLNVYILATHDGAGQCDEAASWLNDTPRLPSDPIRFDVLAVDNFELSARLTLLGWTGQGPGGIGLVPVLVRSSRSGRIDAVVDTIGVDLWRPTVMSSIRDFVASVASASATSTVRSVEPVDLPQPHALVDSLMADVFLHIAIESFDMRVAGSDPKNDIQACRGLAVHNDVFVVEYILQASHRSTVVDFAQRHGLELRDDLRTEAKALRASAPDERAALVRLSSFGFHLDPVVDARVSRGHTKKASTAVGSEVLSDDWELRNRAQMTDLATRRRSIVPTRQKQSKSTGIISVPEISVRGKLRAASDLTRSDGSALDDIVVNFEAESVILKVDLFMLYLCLVAISALKSLGAVPAKAPTVSDVKASRKRPAPNVSVIADIADIHIFLTLPHDVPLYIHLRRPRIQSSPSLGIVIEWDMLLLAGVSLSAPGQWEDIVRFRVTSIAVRSELDDSGTESVVVKVAAESARLRIPFRYVFSRIVDNSVNLVKALKQLIHQHVKGKMDWILEPEAEQAKRIPKVELNVKMFVFEIQDDPFETRLNVIWRAGYEEQTARIERRKAFEAKVAAIEKAANEGEPDSADEEDGQQSHFHHRRRRRTVDAHHSVSIQQAEYALGKYDSTHWAKRVRNAIAEQGRREEALKRKLYGTKVNSREAHLVEVLPTSRSAPLARATFQDFHFALRQPSFASHAGGVADFLHDVGKGLPRDTAFTLLVPLHFSWKLEELRVQIRDYPLPLLHIPPMPPGGGHDHASFECESDLVIAEELSGPQAVRRVPCVVVPARSAQGTGALYTITIPRSAMTVKTYATPIIRIRSPYATRVGWGNSIQPAIQDVARVIDTLSKASPDPSERIGFWDKIRLQFHWRIQFLFEGDSPINIHLKGGRDPYALQGFGAGFVKSWRGNAKILLGLPNPDHEFFQVQSSEYILGIPNLREYVDAAASGMARDPGEQDDRSTQYSGDGRRFSHEADVIKICAKFSGGVRWGMGAVLERACPVECSRDGCSKKSAFHRQCRFFDFIPHWEVHTKTAEAVSPSGEVSDSFAGFRSDFIHFSISLTSPLSLSLPSDPDPPFEFSGSDGEVGLNSLYFSPQASTHFWAWWKLFDSSMSLPIRQGKLFPSAQPPSKKFGKHCATIKYRFSLAPLYIAHTYRLESWHDWQNGITSMVGLKGRIERFNVDLHQREQEEIVRRANSSETRVERHKVFSHAEVNCDGVDLRVLSAQFSEPEKTEFAPDDPDLLEDLDQTRFSSNADGTVRDEDLPWVDLDDFVDAVYTIPDRDPKLRILPLLACPNFSYIRDNDAITQADETEGDDAQRVLHNKFGHEPSHTCLLGKSKSALGIQVDSAKDRLAELHREAESPSVRRDPSKAEDLSRRIRSIEMIIQRLETVEAEIASHATEPPQSSHGHGHHPSRPADHEDLGSDRHFPHLNETLYDEQAQEWANRYIISSPAIQISNTTRQLLLQYYYSQRERKGFSYHLSAKAIKFIKDLATERKRKARHSRRQSTHHGSTRSKKSSAYEDAQQTNRLLDELSSSTKGFWATNESADDGSNGKTFGDALDVDPAFVDADLPSSFEVRNGHLVSFIKPQISLRSDLDDRSTVIITAFRAVLQVHQVLDLRLLEDPINKQVLSKTYGTLQDMQIFYPRAQTGQSSRASFVPLETLLDLRMESLGFDRILPRTSAALRYDKFNQLRMSSKLNLDDVGFSGPVGSHFTSGTDRVSVECAQFSVNAEPDHFAAMYNVVTDLLLYTDPHQKSRNQALEKMVFTTDWSNLDRAARSVAQYQEDLRQIGDIAHEFQVHLEELSPDHRRELFSHRAHFAQLAADLNLVVQAISRAQSYVGASRSSKSAGIQFEARASELVWHMLDKSGTNFVKFSIKGVEFSWMSKQDSSVSNRLVIKDLRALNSSPDHVFAEIISKHDHEHREHELAKVDVFAAVLWNSLAPVGGISIVEQFEFHLHPVRLQLEHRIGRQILDYVFSQRRKAVDDTPAPTPPPKRPGLLTVPNGSNSSYSRSTDSLVSSIRSNGRPASYIESANRSSANLGTPSSSIHALRRAVSAEALIPGLQEEEGLDADEMRRRAALNRTFILVDFTSTVLYLTYRSEKEDHSHLPDVYNITFRTPNMQYRNKTWSFLDLISEVKSEVMKSIWSQKGALIGQLLSTAHRRLPLQDARSAAKKSLAASLRNRLHLKRSPHATPEPGARQPSSLRIVAQKPSADYDAADSTSIQSSEAADDDPEVDEPRVFGDSPFSAEPDAMSMNGESLLTHEESMSNLSYDQTGVFPKAIPARLSTKDSGSTFPLHHAVAPRSLTGETEESKKRLLLGKSA